MNKSLTTALMIMGVLVTSVVCAAGSVVINEVAWGGEAGNPQAEWIELYNPTDNDVDLSGWRLISSDGSPNVTLAGSIDSHGFIVLSRQDGDSTVDGDFAYSGALRDGGEGLRLIDSAGNEVDAANRRATAWPAGASGEEPRTMERINPQAPDSPDNWASSTTMAPSGLYYGTPGARNSVSNIPPVPAFSFSPDPAYPGEPVRFDASRSGDSDGKVVAYLWNFGDATIGRGQTTSHTYLKVGEHVVSLTVQDDRGGVAQETGRVTIIVKAPPLVDFSVQPSSSSRILQSLDPVLFLDESSDPAGRIVAWAWDFGDGKLGGGQTASHTYNTGGVYVISHTVTDAWGETVIQTRSLVVASRAPVAAFGVSPARPNKGAEVTLDAGGAFDLDGTIAQYDWDLDGDGTVDRVGDDPIITVSFADCGEQKIILSVIDDSGTVSLPHADVVDVNCPPQAAMQVSEFSPDEDETVRFSDCSHDEDGTISSWRWDFGDGISTSGKAAQHAYQEDGTYTVTLTVTDNNGATASVRADVNVANLAPVANVQPVGDVLTGDSVLFDGSQSRDMSPQGKTVLYEWDFDGNGTYDETTSEPTLSRTFSDDGVYSVTLRVTDDDGATAVSAPVTVTVSNRPPTAAFSWSPESPTDAEGVAFAGTAKDTDGTIASWRWDFGDGTTAAGSAPSHRFPDDGTYTVKLVVTDDDGAPSHECARKVAVANAVPLASFEFSPTSPRVGAPVSFRNLSRDQSPTGSIVHVAWDFGDGITCPGNAGECGDGAPVSPVHIYNSPGTYTVTMVAIDEQGAIARTSRLITVTE